MNSNLSLLVTFSLVSVTACSSGGAGDGGGGEGTGLATVCPPRTSKATLPGAAGAGGGGLTEVAAFGENPGGLKMFVHAPPGGKANAVVVAMHGCTQGASDYVAAGWNELADSAGFAVVYPEQTTANSYQKCFRWYEKGQIARGAGEARSIAAMTEHALAAYGATRAFVTGLSAGAAMTAVMLATYPDLFEAGAIMAGLPYACATSQSDAYSCMSPGRDKTAAAWAALVPAAGKGAPPRVSIWHGDADWIVRPMNETQLARQWAGVNGIATEPGASSVVDGVTHVEYKDTSGAVKVETWLVKGMGHGVALAPKAGCGKAGAYMLDEGVCSTTKTAEFFGLVAAGAAGAPGGGGGGGGGAGGGGASPAGAGGGDCPP